MELRVFIDGAKVRKNDLKKDSIFYRNNYIWINKIGNFLIY
jgi:hypothetical protein